VNPGEARFEELLAELERLGEENAGLVQRLSDAESRFRLVARGVLRLQEQERGRISRELHDGIGQSLSALKMQLVLLADEAGQRGDERAVLFRDLCAVADSALQDVRQLSHLLRPQMLDELGLLPTLRWLVRTVRERTGIDAVLEHAGIEEDRLDPELETLAYRFVQEALTNAAKHAPSSRVQVAVRAGQERLRLQVSDDGPGFDPATLSGADDSAGFGLRGLRERVRLFGGRLDVQSKPGRGTTLAAAVPLAAGRP
jgi:two-component system sensor histidine kinase UhpB